MAGIAADASGRKHELPAPLGGRVGILAIQRERQLLAEKRALMQQDRNLSRKRLRRESLRSSLSVWDADNDND